MPVPFGRPEKGLSSTMRIPLIQTAFIDRQKYTELANYII